MSLRGLRLKIQSLTGLLDSDISRMQNDCVLCCPILAHRMTVAIAFPYRSKVPVTSQSRHLYVGVQRIAYYYAIKDSKARSHPAIRVSGGPEEVRTNKTT